MATEESILRETTPLVLVVVPADAAALRAEFPQHTIWRAGGIWQAAGPCPDLGCLCTRTVHAPTVGGLRCELVGRRCA
ncbi:hypothetical protein ACIBG7_18515 [Nonomuraea sp. NPDC050328]|uniref:hypothetical protein n=1 Tax=Nonomuraea sp. NPDC050328 TaxID=3364361 RepID=UPI00379FA0D9